MVRTGVYGYNEKGHPQFDIIGYAATREEANIMLADYNRDPWDVDKAKITMEDLYKLWTDKKAPKLGTANQSALRVAFKHCSKLWGREYKQIKAYQMQETIDQCGRGYSTQAAIKNLWGHLDRFALELDVINKCYSDLLTSQPVPPTSRDRFSAAEIATVWEHQSEPWVDAVLILLYSGWRISELLALGPGDIDLRAGTMTGGTKTKAGKNRIVPIHSKIRPLVEARLAEGGEKLLCYGGKPVTISKFRDIWRETMEQMGMEHVPHECRHTFESLLDAAGANRRCIDLLMGHTSKDTGNRVYNHKTIEDLQRAVELITN